MLAWNEVQQILARHNLVRNSAAASPWDGLLLGNADMGAIVWGPASRLTFRLAKLDLWDARWNEKNYRHPLPLSKLKKAVRAASRNFKPGQPVPLQGSNDLNHSWPGGEELYPCLRMGADLFLRVGRHEPTFPAPLTQSLRLFDALYEARFAVGTWNPEEEIIAQAFVSWQRNVLALKLRIPAAARSCAVISLWRDPYGARSWELLSSGDSIRNSSRMDPHRDPRCGMLPQAEITARGNSALLYQVIPGDEYCPQRGFAIQALCAEGAEFFIEGSGHAALEALDRDELTIFIAITSEMEAPQAKERAKKLAADARRLGWNTLYREHAKAWQDFWMRSAVRLEEKSLERAWVRSCYGLGVNARAGRPAPGLFGVSIMNDAPPWRGDRHNNYPEYSSIFWAAYPTNHEEQARNYPEFVYRYLPMARRIAREVFECARGAAFPSNYIDGSEQYFFHFTWSWSLFLAALHAQNCWWHYQYFGDREFLRRLAYPVMRECALFYGELLKKNPPGDYTFFPTIATEIDGWTANFKFNRNCIEDLAHIKFLMRAVIEAATILDVDEADRKCWQDILANIPSYPTITVNGKVELVDFAGRKQRPAYNHSVPLAPFWPAEDPDLIRNPKMRQTILNTLKAHHWDSTRLGIAYLRLGLKKELFKLMFPSQEQPDNNDGNAGCAGVMPGFAGTTPAFRISELLLTSWDNIIRVFPGWPLEKKAEFFNLRAKGAFLVSASCAGGKIGAVRVQSARGNPLTIQSPFSKTRIFNQTTGRAVAPAREGRLLRFGTAPGEVYRLEQ